MTDGAKRALKIIAAAVVAAILAGVVLLITARALGYASLGGFLYSPLP